MLSWTSLWILLALFLVVVLCYDLFQKEHSILRNYPLIGHLRYFAESLGVYLRQYWYSNDREELPFNRAQRSWVYQAAKNVDTNRGFGSTRDSHRVGSFYFIDAPFPVLEQDAVKSEPVTIGPNTLHPYTTSALINISAMSYGAISKNAILALGAGAKMAGCWLNTGEGGVSPYHLESGCDLVAQIGSAKFGFRDEEGNFSTEKLQEIAAYPQVKMFEIKLSQGAKPGKGGLLMAAKVTPEIAKIRGVRPYQDVQSPNRFEEISNCAELLDFIDKVRSISGKPTGFKVALGDYDWLDDLCKEIINRGENSAPDFITLDGSEGGTGAAPASLMDFVGLPVYESLPVLIDLLIQYDLRKHIKVIVAGKLVTPEMIGWALAVGADFVNSARGFLFALGCIQSLRCHNNTCPTGITTHNPWLTRGLDPKQKSVRVYHYVKNLEYEVGVICHSCGVNRPRGLTRKHVRYVTEHGTSVCLADIYPDKTPIPHQVL